MVGNLTKQFNEKSNAPHTPGHPTLQLNIYRCIIKSNGFLCATTTTADTSCLKDIVVWLARRGVTACMYF
jgi:hypothetical protein